MASANPTVQYIRTTIKNAVAVLVQRPELEVINTDAVGDIPPFYQITTSPDTFNKLTYDWIASRFRSGSKVAPPIMDTSKFWDANYLQILNSLAYGLSAKDQNDVNKARQEAQYHVGTLLQEWKRQGYPTPDPLQNELDWIVGYIADNWADPPTSWQEMAESNDLKALLNKRPASSDATVAILKQVLDAFSAVTGIMNALTKVSNNVGQGRNAIDNPTERNGGLKVGVAGGQTTLLPAYNIAPSQAAILSSLDSAGRSVRIQIYVTRFSREEYSISVNGGPQYNIPVSLLFRLTVGGLASYFEDNVAIQGNQVTLSIEYPGVTFVSFGPRPYDFTTLQNWFFPTWIAEAVKNYGKGVTGVTFFPSKPNIDLERGGPFGFVGGVAISRNPNFTVAITGSNFQKLSADFKQSPFITPTFLGVPYGQFFFQATSPRAAYTVTENTSTSTVTLNMVSPLLASNVDPNAVRTSVLGGIAVYPGASTSNRVAEALDIALQSHATEYVRSVLEIVQPQVSPSPQ